MNPIEKMTNNFSKKSCASIFYTCLTGLLIYASFMLMTSIINMQNTRGEINTLADTINGETEKAIVNTIDGTAKKTYFSNKVETYCEINNKRMPSVLSGLEKTIKNDFIDIIEKNQKDLGYAIDNTASFNDDELKEAVEQDFESYCRERIINSAPTFEERTERDKLIGKGKDQKPGDEESS